MNGMNAVEFSEGMDLDQILGDPQLRYREKKTRLVNALREAGYFSEREMMLDDANRNKMETSLLNQSDKEKKEEEMLVETEETKARFNQALKVIAEKDSDALEDMICELVPEMKKFHEFLDMTLSGSQYNNGVMITGSGGLRKSWHVLVELKKRNLPFALYNSHSSSLGLFELLYKNRDSFVVLDDLETLLDDKKSVGILKAALFSSTGVREITWASTSRVLAERGLPERFVFNGKIIIISNDSHNSRSESFKAFKSRLYVHELKLSAQGRKILVRSILLKQNIFDLSDDVKNRLLEYMEGLLNGSNIDQYNLRTAIKACEVFKLKGEAGLPLIADLLGVEPMMQKFLFIQDKGKNLTPGQKLDVWKSATGLSVSSYYSLKAKSYYDKYSADLALEKELMDIEAAIEEIGRL
jgi:hypothetical protein